MVDRVRGLCRGMMTLGVLLWGAAAGSQQTSDDVRSMLLEAVRANKGALSEKVRIDLRYERGVSETSTFFKNIAVVGNRFALNQYLSAEDLRADKPCAFVACDGEVRLDCRSESAPGSPFNHAALSGVTEEFEPFGRDFHLFSIGFEGSMDPEEILSSPDAVINPVPKKVGGVLAFEVSLERMLGEHEGVFKYWFAPEMSCNPVRRQLWMNGHLFSEKEYADFERLSNGVWFPRKIIDKRYEGENLEYVCRFFLECVSIDFTVEEALFDTSLDRVPAGYMIYGRTTGLGCVQGWGSVGDETVSRVTEDLGNVELSVQDETTDTGASAAPGEEGVPESRASGSEPVQVGGHGVPYALILGVAFVVLIGAIVVVARRRGK